MLKSLVYIIFLLITALLIELTFAYYLREGDRYLELTFPFEF
jgi:hypothetical protein